RQDRPAPRRVARRGAPDETRRWAAPLPALQEGHAAGRVTARSPYVPGLARPPRRVDVAPRAARLEQRRGRRGAGRSRWLGEGRTEHGRASEHPELYGSTREAASRRARRPRPVAARQHRRAGLVEPAPL